MEAYLQLDIHQESIDNQGKKKAKKILAFAKVDTNNTGKYPDTRIPKSETRQAKLQ